VSADPKASATRPGVESPGIRHVYVHAPFCARRCPYCDFAVHVRRQGGRGEWLEALGAELDWRRDRDPDLLAQRLDTLFVGGGTPSLLGEGAMAGLADLLGPARLRGEPLEWTAEANPESFSPSLARDWRGAGVNRVSLGVQTFQAPGLKWMGRLHGPEGADTAVEAARAAGFRDLSIDLIFGLPAHLERDLEEDLDRVLSLDLPHVSLYGLSVEEGTPLARWIREAREEPLDEERYAEEYLRIADRLTGEGYTHYEVSNFARPGHASVHNRAYWEGVPYLGLGNGAHSFVPPVRSWNLREWNGYRSRMATGGDPVDASEELTPEDRALEEIWLGLRTRSGLDEGRLTAAALALAEDWIRRGWALREDRRIRLTAEGWLLLDRLVVELSQAQEAQDPR